MPDTSRHPAASGVRIDRLPHLSIGEVLGLLLEEFPDVTISKIRFLESQGLIEPERTPSGYRKFFDHDVELLRLILREQREKFLPLRVIKDRIDSGEIGKDEDPGEPASRGGTGDPSTPGAAPEQRLPDLDDDAAGAPQASNSVDAGEPTEGPVADDARTNARRHADAEVATSADTTDPAGDEAPSVAPDAGGDEKAGPQAATTGAVGDPDAAGTDEPPDRDLLTGAELASRANTTTATIDDLRSYGLITATESLGEALFDEDAAQIAGICVRFIDVGVDVRHLRGWKTSSDRETSVYEGLTLPLLRQRNPQGRRAARDRLVELNELGASLRRALMESTLRHHLEH